MAERVAKLEALIGDYSNWKNRVEDHDRKQDDALYALETRASRLETLFAKFLEDQEKATKRSDRRQKIIIGLTGISGIDALGWNLWHRMAPVLSPFVSEEFFWFTIGTIGLAAALYATWNMVTRRKEK